MKLIQKRKHFVAFISPQLAINLIFLRSVDKNLEFDFMDDVSAPTMRVRTQNTAQKGPAKKKTANFASVIDAMKKNKRSLHPPPKE